MKTQSEKAERWQDDLPSKNPSVNVTIVGAYRELELQLLKLGIKVKRRYSIEPPLGFNRNKFHTLGFNRNKFHNQSD